MWSPLRALSFDLDDTLWEVGPVLARAEATLGAWLAERHPRLAALHQPEPARLLRQQIIEEHPKRAHDLSFVRTESLRRLALASEVDPAVAEQAFAVFRAARNQIEPYPDVPGVLAGLAARYPLYALSNGNAEIHRTPLAAHFAFGVSPGEAGVAKPDRRIFEHLFERAGVQAADVIHVGDDPVTDVAGARAAGCRTVWVNRRGLAWPSHLQRPDAEIDDLHGLVRLLRDGP
jgi:putative hydrolase of the HAD superfamily